LKSDVQIRLPNIFIITHLRIRKLQTSNRQENFTQSDYKILWNHPEDVHIVVIHVSINFSFQLFSLRRFAINAKPSFFTFYLPRKTLDVRCWSIEIHGSRMTKDTAENQFINTECFYLIDSMITA